MMNIRFMPYESKPITRMAIEIPAGASILELDTNTYVFQDVTFKAYQQPVAGDYIVRLTEEDTYHVARDVFHDRNIVEPVEAKAPVAGPAPGEYPKVTSENIEANIADEKYLFDGKLTVCVLTMKNGIKVPGYSACVDPRNFDEAKGRKYSREDAINSVWPMMGFALADRMMTSAASKAP